MLSICLGTLVSKKK